MSIVERALGKVRQPRPPDGNKQPGPPVDRGAGAASGDPALGAPVKLDFDGLRAAAMMAPSAQERAIASEFRHIKRTVVARALGRHPVTRGDARVVLIASALPGDGKTFTAFNLALSLALERDLSVLLIDGDVVKPQISAALGLGGASGLLDVLRNPGANPEAAVHPTDVPNMAFMPAGRAGDDATELIASDAFLDVARALLASDRRRVLVLDSCPLLAASEARGLADLAGQVLLVVKSEVTPRHAVLSALQLLGPDRDVGLVLNQLARDGVARYGNYGGYGSYGSYGGYDAARGLPPGTPLPPRET
jgi:Mrp family chromosome partitioning ATPase